MELSQLDKIEKYGYHTRQNEKKIEFEIASEYQEKETKGVYVDTDQDLILAGVQYEIGWKWEKE